MPLDPATEAAVLAIQAAVTTKLDDLGQEKLAEFPWFELTVPAPSTNAPVDVGLLHVLLERFPPKGQVRHKYLEVHRLVGLTSAPYYYVKVNVYDPAPSEAILAEAMRAFDADPSLARLA